MLDARVPAGGWKEEERRTEEEREGKIAALLEETRLWRTANSAQWVAWGIVQAKIPGLVSADVVGGGGGVEGEKVDGVVAGDVRFAVPVLPVTLTVKLGKKTKLVTLE